MAKPLPLKDQIVVLKAMTEEQKAQISRLFAIIGQQQMEMGILNATLTRAQEEGTRLVLENRKLKARLEVNITPYIGY